jgi:hypothetical protein
MFDDISAKLPPHKNMNAAYSSEMVNIYQTIPYCIQEDNKYLELFASSRVSLVFVFIGLYMRLLRGPIFLLYSEPNIVRCSSNVLAGSYKWFAGLLSSDEIIYLIINQCRIDVTDIPTPMKPCQSRKISKQLL